jgi:hypothetical protein
VAICLENLSGAPDFGLSCGFGPPSGETFRRAQFIRIIAFEVRVSPGAFSHSFSAF